MFLQLHKALIAKNKTVLVVAFYSIPELGWLKCEVCVGQVMVEKFDRLEMDETW